jgi:hypothetical protein
MDVTISEEFIPTLMTDQRVQDWFSDGDLICKEVGSDVVITLKVGRNQSIMYDLVDILINLSIDYALKV